MKLNKIKTFRLKKIKNTNGDILRLGKNKDPFFTNFGEIYFSWVKPNKIKAWKFHKKMSLNLFVSKGKVKFVFPSKNRFRVIEIEEKKNLLLKIPPKIWFGFKGLSRPNSLILNLANAIHNKNELIVRDIKYFNYNWSKK